MSTTQEAVTRAAVELGEMAKELGSQAEVARQLGISAVVLGQYLCGRCRPRTVLRKAIEKWSGGRIPEDWWETAEERRTLAKIKPTRGAA